MVSGMNRFEVPLRKPEEMALLAVILFFLSCSVTVGTKGPLFGENHFWFLAATKKRRGNNWCH